MRLVVVAVAFLAACQHERADCDAIAEAQTSAEIGNYAPPEQRAPVVARHRAECEAAPPSRDCGEVIVRIHQAVQHQIDLVGSAARTMMASMLPAMQAACEQDGWPDALKRCVTGTKPGDLAALQQCNSLMSPEQAEKLQRRLGNTKP